MLDISLPGYTLSEKAYGGSETTVYRGRRDEGGVEVAIKLTSSEYPTARQLARLRREFDILRELDIPGVVKAYALEKCGRGLALVMQDLGPCPLAKLIDENERLDIKPALDITIALAATLESLHQRGIVHKDVKPRNVIIGPDGRTPHLIDFGIATRLSQEAQRLTSPDALEGTLTYMSPEQTGRMNRTVDLRTDLYSLGVTLYELLTGAPPFQSADSMELIHSHIARMPTPPHERAPHIPQTLSAIVVKLLAKMPEERYQSARGLSADLEACLEQWQKTGDVAPFALGRRDRVRELRVPQKLYGREQDIEVLLLAFERVRRGAAELLLVSGYSGVGKSALVHEVHRPIARQGGYFVGGKFDQISRDVPLSAVAAAFRDLVRQILSEPAERLVSWKAKLVDALGSSGRMLVELVPELSLIVGPQPELPPLGPNESSNRFRLVVLRFLKVFATAEHPLAIYMDDLQWADPASLKLLQAIVTDPESGHILLIGAYRDNEVDATSPLLSTLDEIEKAGAALTALTLKPLDLRTATRIIADTLRDNVSHVEPLARVIFKKTHGNPFFLGQFLAALHADGLVRYDDAREGFAWDIERIGQAMVTGNVVDLMLGKLQRVSPAAQRVLKLAACIGHEFDLSTLATIEARPAHEVAEALWEALREGLILPQTGDYRLLESAAGEGSSPGELKVSYRFLHDRVLQATYSLIEPAQKAAVHLEIGRLLRSRSGDTPHEQDLLEIVRHLTLGADRMVERAERDDLARLCLRAGTKAKISTAYDAAAAYLTTGVALIGDGGWDRDYALSFALHIEAVECVYLTGAFDRAEELFETLLGRVRSKVERARVLDLKLNLYMTMGRFADAVRVAREALALFGITLPDGEAEQQALFGAQLAEVAANLGGRRIQDFVDAPVVNDPETRAVLQILGNMAMPVYFVSPGLFGPTVLMQVNSSLKHGNSDVSAWGYMTYAFMLAGILGRPDDAEAFGELALALNDRIQNPAITPKLNLLFGSFYYVTKPLRGAVPYFHRARDTAFELGDFVYISSTCYSTIATRFGAGYQLEDVREEIERYVALMQRTKDVTAGALMRIWKQVVTCLQGRTHGRTSLSDSAFDEERFMRELDEKEHAIAFYYYYALKLELHCLAGNYEAAIRAGQEAERRSMSAMGLFFTVEVSFFMALALLAAPIPHDAEEAKRRDEEISRHRERVATLAKTAPANFEHRLLLIDAEIARRAGDHAQALERYERAIVLAEEHEFPQIEALANERCADLHLAQGKAKAARGYLMDAYLGYKHWGANGKASTIEEEHGHRWSTFVENRRPSSGAASTASSSSASRTTLLNMSPTSIRESLLVVRAAQTITSELLLPRVIERLMRIVLENAGAQRGALILQRDGRLFVEATFSAQPDKVDVGPSAALDTRIDIPHSVILLVTRTREPLVVSDAAVDTRFVSDPYILTNAPRSMLCTPLTHQGRLAGVLYLENNTAAGSFTEQSAVLLGLLAAQAAIAIENAQLIASVHAANEEVWRANERLEAEVAQRTQELQSSNWNLNEANQRLQIELAQRAQAERERAALQEQMIMVQRERLAELSTPLIPITDQIMVMPLIGTVDAERARQVLEVALTGAQRYRARVVILDITGIKDMDQNVAGTLIQTANALRLLGTEAVLTGVSPDAAQAMVGRGIDLKTMVTMGMLQSGIAYALASARRVRRSKRSRSRAS